jgi:hypothetical protein
MWTLAAHREEPRRGGRGGSRQRLDAMRNGKKIVESHTTVFRMRRKNP